MAQYYTLDEASKLLGMKPDEFRKRLATEWKTLRRFPDGATLRFQSRDIDELARRAGRSSEPELQLGEAPLKLAEEAAPSIKRKTDDAIYIPPTGDDFVPLAVDDPSNTTGKTGKSGSDSDVKLEKTAGGSVRPVTQKDDVTEVIAPDGDKKKDSKSFEIKSESPKKPTRTTHTASEFELSLTTDSDEFDLELTDDSDEVPVGQRSKKSRPGDSGINLQDPADSGISLEKESSEFELQLEPGMAGPKTAPVRRDGPKTDPLKKGAKKDDSDSEFELTLDEPSDVAATAFDSGEQKDIFETDFELPAIDDSSSEDKPASDSNLDESDFDLAADDGTSEDSASEVVAIEEDETAEDDLEPIEDEEADARPAAAAAAMVAAPTAWGPLPIIALMPCTAVMFIVGMMGYELLNSMWGHQTRTPVPGFFVKTVAGMFGEVKD
jgi:hypothetical protein